MVRKNKYSKRAQIPERKIREIVKLFALDLEATKTAKLTGLNLNTISRYYNLIGEKIARHCEAESPLDGVVEADESYFGAKQVKGKRGRGASEKTIV